MFGTNLRKWRIKRKLTQADLANKLSNLLGKKLNKLT